VGVCRIAKGCLELHENAEEEWDPQEYRHNGTQKLLQGKHRHAQGHVGMYRHATGLSRNVCKRRHGTAYETKGRHRHE
jgi:hypothetical protein